EITYAVANITVFGLVVMLLYPYLAHMLFPNDMTSAGLFLGTAIHETAQVAGSGLIYAQLFDADKALEAATVAKLVRNLMMIAIIPLIAYRHQQQQQHTEETAQKKKFSLLNLFPVFILGFLLLAIVRSIGDAALDAKATGGLFDAADWDSFTTTLKHWAENFLAMAMAGVGLNTSFKKLRGLGLKPFYVGFGAAVSVSAMSLTGIALLRLLGLS
ncbi:MAG: putative sulfate exporter family transporter, partial [Anaerolineae bacterium]|nr:putative sulfate exporter family transporter [Anaerolineae bacterium]